MQTTSLQTNTYFRSSLLSEIRLASKRRNGWDDERARRSKAGRGRSKRLSQIWSTEIFENGKNYYHSLQNRPFLSRFLGKRRQARSERGGRDARDRGGGEIVFLRIQVPPEVAEARNISIGEHRLCCTQERILLHTIRNIRIYMEKKPRKMKAFQ